MRKLLLLSFLFLSVTHYSQAQKNNDILPYVNGKITYTEVVQMDSTYTKEQLFQNALVWIHKEANHYNSQIKHKNAFNLNDNIIINDPQKGELIGTCRIRILGDLSPYIYSFDAYVYTKDGKYKYDFSNFRYLGTGTKNPITKNVEAENASLESSAHYKGLSRKIDAEMKDLIKSFKKDMERKSASKDF